MTEDIDKAAKTSDEAQDGQSGRWTPTPEQLDAILLKHRRFAQASASSAERTENNRANLENAILNGCDLNGKILSGAKLNGAFIEDAQLEGAHLDFARLNNANLSMANLAGADLRKAKLVDANLRKAKLQGANLEGADLTRANLKGANLIGTVLQGDTKGSIALKDCSLRDAILEGQQMSKVEGLQSSGIGGANTLRAELPDEIAKFDALKTAADISARARVLFISMIAACLYSWLTIASTTDGALILNSGSTPLPIIQTQVPIAWFYWIAPWILLALFFYLQLYLQRLWEALSSLPAVFPSGRSLHEEAYPWLLSSLVLAFVPNLRERRPAFWWLQLGLSVVAGWMLVPFTILGYWARYLPRHDWSGTIAILVAFVIAAAGAVAFWRHAEATLRDGHAKSIRRQWEPESAMAVFAAVNLLLATLTFVQPIERIDVLGIRNYATLTGEELSTRPSDWWKLSEEDRKELKGVVGVPLPKADLRHANAAGVFLAKADLRWVNLFGADFEGANLQEADLFGAHLRSAELQGANLQGANLQGADLLGAELQEANLQGASLQAVDLQGADLEKANLQGANLLGAELNGANFQRAELQGANLLAAKLEGTDLLGANLWGAKLWIANLQGATLEGAFLGRANLQGANLLGGNLQGAHLQGADLRRALLLGAKLEGADLKKADLRDSRGLICKWLRMARNWADAYRNRNLSCDQAIPEPPPIR